MLRALLRRFAISMTDTPDSVTELLAEASRGNADALDRLLPLVYHELHAIAARYLRREKPGHTLQPTALVNEAYLRLVGQREVTWQNRAHFFGVAASMMRRILVDHARAHRAEKRAGGLARVTLNEANLPAAERDVDLIALDDALADLAARDAKLARLVELKFFAGLTTKEVAEVLGVSSSTVEREWVAARAWLFRAMTKGTLL
jgi:RNA polymerase sigma factor (TIGR02999 family)